MIWNPLEFLEEFEKPQDLNLDEVRDWGRKTGHIANEQNVPWTGTSYVVHGREVGDDRVDLSSSPDSLCTILMAQEEICHMVTSAEDTSIRKRSWNFCEVTGGPLTDPTEGFDHARKGGDFTNLGFNDSIILRIILDVQKGEGEDHSSTQPGKMSMLGSRLATPRKENRKYWMIASVLQDAMLCTHKASEPKYLPPVMGGTGVTPLFDNSNNVFLYVLAYKGGAYRRIYGTACAEMQDYLYKLERGVQSAPVLCPRLREKQEYFWGTYDNMVFVPKVLDVGDSKNPPTPLYTATGGQNRFVAFENRLLRTRHTVTRRQAQTEWRHSRRLCSIFQSLFPEMKTFEMIDKDLASRRRAAYDGALSANSALQNLLRREGSRSDAMKLMGSDAFYTITVGKRDFTRYDSEWVYLNGQGENYSLRDVTLSEDVFVRDEVSSEETFKIEGITLRPFFSGGTKTVSTKAKVGLYQINQSMEEWCENLLHRLKERRSQLGRPLRPQEAIPIFNLDREWVNDDTGLIGQCLEDTAGEKNRYTVLLVSDDRRLANQMAETCNVTVTRVKSDDFSRLCILRGEQISSSTQAEFLREYGLNFDFQYVDTGSILASARMYEEQDGTAFRRTLRETGWRNGTRFSSITLEKVQVKTVRKYTHVPVTRPKIFKSGSRSHESAYSSHSSWKSSSRAMSNSDWRSERSQPHTLSPSKRR